jgi:hypothetical protein
MGAFRACAAATPKKRKTPQKIIRFAWSRGKYELQRSKKIP